MGLENAKKIIVMCACADCIYCDNYNSLCTRDESIYLDKYGMCITYRAKPEKEG